MRERLAWIFLATGILASVALLMVRPSKHSPTLLALGNEADSKLQTDFDDTTRFAEIDKNPTATVYVFLSTNCPISNACVPELKRIADRFTDVDLIGVFPQASLSAEKLQEYSRQYQLNFPVVVDASRKLTHRFQATHTPQAFVQTDPGTVVYSGQIDNHYVGIAGQKRQAASQHFLQAAIDAVMAGRRPEVSETNPVGCIIESVSRDTISHVTNGRAAIAQQKTEAQGSSTFNANIAAIIFQQCTPCHREGEAAPFPLESFADVRNHGEQIRRVIADNQMPPWKPDAGFGEFKNERRLTAGERTLLSNWISAGMPEGRGQSAPAVPQFAAGWQMGTPDLVLVMPEAFDVPADGPDIYQHFVIPTGLVENQQVEAVEFRPGAPEVVHHAFMYFDTTGRARELDALDPRPGYEKTGSPGFRVSGSLGGWGPGGIPRRLPRGYGRPLAAHSDLLLQVHYHPVGRPVSDRSTVGLYFSKVPDPHPVTEIMVANVDLKIPAGTTSHIHRAEYTLPVTTTIFDCTPHMHVLGKHVEVTATKPDGQRIPLIRISDWDFYWQDNYVLANPLTLPTGTKIEMTCWYDNSAGNLLNPHNPPRDVYWGDDSTDEMGVCYFQATAQSANDYFKLNKHALNYFERQWQKFQQAKSRRTRQGR